MSILVMVSQGKWLIPLYFCFESMRSLCFQVCSELIP